MQIDTWPVTTEAPNNKHWFHEYVLNNSISIP